MGPGFPGNHRPHKLRVLTSLRAHYQQDAPRMLRRQDDYSVLPQIFLVQGALCKLLCKSHLNCNCKLLKDQSATSCIVRFSQRCMRALHQLFALTFLNALLRLVASTVERVSEINLADPDRKSTR